LLFSDLDNLSTKARARLEESWAGVFRREYFSRLDEKPFAVLYSDEYSRPNTPVNVMLGLVQRVHRVLSKADQHRYANEFKPFLKGSSGQYVYHIKGEKTIGHIERIGNLMYWVLQEVSDQYNHTPAFQTLERVFNEHFIIEETG